MRQFSVGETARKPTQFDPPFWATGGSHVRPHSRSRRQRVEKICEPLTDERVELGRKRPVRAGELAQTHQPKGALIVKHRVGESALAHDPFELPQVPLPFARKVRWETNNNLLLGYGPT